MTVQVPGGQPEVVALSGQLHGTTSCIVREGEQPMDIIVDVGAGRDQIQHEQTDIEAESKEESSVQVVEENRIEGMQFMDNRIEKRQFLHQIIQKLGTTRWQVNHYEVSTSCLKPLTPRQICSVTTAVCAFTKARMVTR